MKDAEQALGDGKRGNDRAVDAQGRALQGLQQGSAGFRDKWPRARGRAKASNPARPEWAGPTARPTGPSQTR